MAIAKRPRIPYVPPEERVVLSLYEAADILRISRQALAELLHAGRIPAAQIRTRWLIHRDVLEDWVKGKPGVYVKPEPRVVARKVVKKVAARAAKAIRTRK